MLSLILSIVAGLLVGIGIGTSWPGHPVWCSVFGVLAFLAVSVIINLIMKKKLEKIFNDVQGKILASQEHLKREVQMYQNKGMFSKAIQEKIEQKQSVAVHEAIDMLTAVEPLRKWNFLAGKQADTLHGQLLYQIKEFEAADPFLKKAFVMDPLILAMQMVRMYRKGEMTELEKAYHKGVKRFKGDKSLLIYGLYSWILVKENHIEEAIVVLDEGKKETDNDVLKANWEHVANGRIKRFSNAGLGEMWYALQVEEQRAIKQQAPIPFGGSPRRMR